MSIKQARKGLRVRPDKPEQPVTIQKGAGAKPKSMTKGTAKPASAWFK